VEITAALLAEVSGDGGCPGFRFGEPGSCVGLPSEDSIPPRATLPSRLASRSKTPERNGGTHGTLPPFFHLIAQENALLAVVGIEI